jgi:hypothetical protein
MTRKAQRARQVVALAGDSAETLRCATNLGLWVLALDARLVKRLRQWLRWYSSRPTSTDTAERADARSETERRARKVRRSPADERPAKTVARDLSAVTVCYR